MKTDDTDLRDSLLSVANAGETLRACGDQRDRDKAKLSKLAAHDNDLHGRLHEARDVLHKHLLSFGGSENKSVPTAANNNIEKSFDDLGGHGVAVLKHADIQNRNLASDRNAFDRESNKVFASARDAIDSHLDRHAAKAITTMNAMPTKEMSRETIVQHKIDRLDRIEQRIQGTAAPLSLADNPMVQHAVKRGLVPAPTK